MIDVKDNFGDTIPESWYVKKWPDEVRKQKVTFDLYPDRVFSVFAKVEKGKNYLFPFNKIILFNLMSAVLDRQQ